MPRLVCRACGRRLWATAPLESLFADERRCPRCAAPLHTDRRDVDRRRVERRQNPPDDPGPPGGVERRVGERRQNPRRSTDEPHMGEEDGWAE